MAAPKNVELPGFFRRLRLLFEDSAYADTADIDLVLQDPRRGQIVVPAHRALIATASGALESLCAVSAHPAEGGSGRRQMHIDGSLEGLTPFLHALYYGEAMLDAVTCVPALVCSESFGVGPLALQCERYLPRALRFDDDSAVRAAEAAFDGHLAPLAEFACASLLRCADSLIELPCFYSLPRPILHALLQSDDMCVAEEEKVLAAVIRWGLTHLAAGTREGVEAVTRARAYGSSLILTAADIASELAAAVKALEGDAATATQTTLPVVPPSVRPALRFLLADLFPSMRLAHLSVRTLKSGLVSDVVQPELVVEALFHKIAKERGTTGGSDGDGGNSGGPVDVSAAYYLLHSSGLGGPNGPGTGGGGGGGGGDGLMDTTVTDSRAAAIAYLAAPPSTAHALGSMRASLDRTAIMAAAQFHNSNTGRYVPSAPGAGAGARGEGGQVQLATAARSYLTGTDPATIHSRHGNKGRRYGTYPGAPHFHPAAAGAAGASLGNGGRSIALPSLPPPKPQPPVTAGAARRRRAIEAAAAVPGLACAVSDSDGSSGVPAPVLLVQRSGVAATDREAAWQLVLEDSDALFDVDPEYFFDELDEADVAADLAKHGGLMPFEVALCLCPPPAATGERLPTAVTDIAALGAVWMLTNRGHLYIQQAGAPAGVTEAAAVTPAAAPAPAPAPAPSPAAAISSSWKSRQTGSSSSAAAPAPAPSPAPAAPSPTAAAAPASADTPGKLSLVTIGLPFGVSSGIHLTATTSTTTSTTASSAGSAGGVQVGVAISNTRCCFDAQQAEEAKHSMAGKAGGEGSGSGSSGGGGGAGEGEGEGDGDRDHVNRLDATSSFRRTPQLVAPRIPPSPAVLLPATGPGSDGSGVGLEAAAGPGQCRMLHSADPSCGPHAQLHAALAALPPVAAAGALQLVVVARAPSGLRVTLLPPTVGAPPLEL